MKKYFKASMLLMGLLFIQSTTASATMPHQGADNEW